MVSFYFVVVLSKLFPTNHVSLYIRLQNPFKLLSLPAFRPQISCTVLWNLEQVRAGVVMVEFGAREGESWCRYGRTPAALKTWKHSSFTRTTQNLSKSKKSRIPKSCAVGCQLSLCSDASCHQARLLFRPKIVQKPDEPSNSPLTSKQNSIARSFSSAWLHKPALFPG